MKGWRWFLGLVATLALAGRVTSAEVQRGAAVPWTTYEAESATTNGKVLGPDYAGRSPAREASGRQCVRLAATGDFLQFTAKADAQGLVVRYCIPNTPDGNGSDATLTLYINGKPSSKLPMTSRYSYLYGNYPFNNQPASGSPRHFWNELRLMPGSIHAGDVVRLQKDGDDRASEYLIDLVDLELVPPPLEKPADALSVMDFGAISDGKTDDHAAFEAAISAAREQHRSVWIPPGRFVIKGTIQVRDIAIHGAGMWYSTLLGYDDYAPNNRVSIQGNGSNVTLSDFAIIGKLRYRNDSEANDGIGGSFGTGSVIRNIWVEHTKTGAWLVNSDGLLVEGCRFRDTIADGINLCIGMRNTIVRNCTARGTGDDCFAMWPATYAQANYEPGHNTFVNCTAQLPFLAQGFSIYGGDGNSVQNCKAIDIPYGAGVLASTMFTTQFGFRGTTTYRQIDITRAGDADGAIAVMTNLRDLSGLRFEDIDVSDSPSDGIKFNCINGLAIGDARFDRIRIENTGIGGSGYGVVATRGAVGSATLANVTVRNPRTSDYQDNSSSFNLDRSADRLGANGAENAGANSTLARHAEMN